MTTSPFGGHPGDDRGAPALCAQPTGMGSSKIAYLGAMSSRRAVTRLLGWTRFHQQAIQHCDHQDVACFRFGTG